MCLDTHLHQGPERHAYARAAKAAAPRSTATAECVAHHCRPRAHACIYTEVPQGFAPRAGGSVSTRALRIVLKKLVAQNPAHARGAPWHAQREVGRFQFTSKFPLRVSDATEAVEELENKRGKLRAVGRLLFDGEVILHNAIELCKWETGRSKMQRNRTFRSPGTYPSQNLPIVNLQFAGALPNSGE